MTAPLYKQCELTRTVRNGRERMISWIPANLALVGTQVRLRDGDASPWSDDWMVACVTEPALPARVVQKGSSRSNRMHQAAGV